MTKKRGRGRPPGPTGNAMDLSRNLRQDRSAYDLQVQAAEAQGKLWPEWARETLDRAAKRALR